MTHANAPFTPEGRARLARLIVDQGWPVRRAAERFQCSPATASRWACRYRAGLPLTDRSSRPHRSPSRSSQRLERRIVALRFTRRWGPHRIGYHLGVPRSTVGRVLARYRMPRLVHVDQATGLPVRAPKPVRYEVAAPGELVHVDIKKLGRIPDGGGWRIHGRGSTQDRRAGSARDRAARRGASPSRGYTFLHHAVDDHSRLAYSEQLPDERKETAAGFWLRAAAFFAEHGITVTAVMTDNGSCYRSRAFAAALGNIQHRWTRPYRPQTNGKVERFNRTLATEWAYAEAYSSEATRSATYADWLHHYNHHRPHTGIGGLVPAARVHNLTGKNS
ncbi:IS481 family transposase [Protaetiibacter larvae]|uniref:IS481 family transposase n=1 Tax=Protaetiibacter larvae TaxID=2592654 RepID=A0A5C1Y612_9MICO|nr:IS481 family transposase [Protaetiibacter larvae]QEO08685.1 IS481 family transposase [Protaetiibacter larvae]QEO09391.1 IS481 family transposase [Protaetiibacter larvae]QEO09466.1 IS481 family transposase [Protaetiibacter larvae]